jgi:hypothetical protein
VCADSADSVKAAALRVSARQMMRRLGLQLLFASLAAWGCASTLLVRKGAPNPTRVEQVETGIQKLRGLDFTAEVPVVVKTREQARQIMIKEIERDHSDEQLRIGGETGAMTGLYPPGMDLKAETLKLLTDQIAGFYNPDDKEMVLVRGGSGNRGVWTDIADFFAQRDIAGEMILAHELTHALQDQHFQINEMLKRVKDNDDKSLALKCVAEGDATLAGFGYVAGRIDQKSIDLLTAQLAALPETFAKTSKGVPVSISTPLLFQYSGGVRFVGEAWRRGGWAGVNALYHNPPTSTQEIMQPKLYFDHLSPPAQIELSGYAAMLKDWKKIDDDTYGELLLKLTLERNLPQRPAALQTITRWAGDRIITLQNGKALTLLWIVVFRDTASADEFAASYDTLLGHLPGENNLYGIEAHGSAVLVVIGAGAARFAALASAIWRASKITSAEAPSASSKTVGVSSAVGGVAAAH